jgi:hypothetical protein
MDYEALLKKYVQHVGEYEGSTFINWLNSPHCDVKFTDEEVAELERISEELHS